MIATIGKAQIMIGVKLNRRGQESSHRVVGPPSTLFPRPAERKKQEEKRKKKAGKKWKITLDKICLD